MLHLLTGEVTFLRLQLKAFFLEPCDDLRGGAGSVLSVSERTLSYH